LRNPLFAPVEGELKEKDPKPDGTEKFIIKYAGSEQYSACETPPTRDQTSRPVPLFPRGKADKPSRTKLAQRHRTMKGWVGFENFDGYIVPGAKSQGEGWEEDADVEPVNCWRNGR
jgi:hypothetical protein